MAHFPNHPAFVSLGKRFDDSRSPTVASACPATVRDTFRSRAVAKEAGPNLPKGFIGREHGTWRKSPWEVDDGSLARDDTTRLDDQGTERVFYDGFA